jgi:methyl-accepting chemotaxis protein
MLMNNFSLSNHRIGIILLIAVLSLTAVLHFQLQLNHQQSLKEINQQLRIEIEQSLFLHKKDTVESTFSSMYDSIRTISLLPSIRAIQGGNVTQDNEDIIAEKRITKDGWNTVQQLYNNLVEHISVSEIYATVNGFKPHQGETPFFYV